MDNFDLQKYLAEGRIHSDSNLLTEKKDKKAKKQGDNDELDDSLGAKNGKKKQDMKQRRADSENEEKSKGKRKYSGDKSKDKVNEKQDSKKGNESEQKRMEGAIKDDRDHIKGLKKDIEDNERKLARLKKDYKRDVIKEEEIDESAIAVAAGVASIFGGAVAADKAMDALEAGKLGEKGKAFAKFLRQAGSAAGDVTQVREEDVEEGYGKPMYDEDDTDAKNESKKGRMKVSELKAKIREDILSTLNEDEDVDVDVDFEDEVNIDAEGDDIEIERPAVKAKVNVGLSPEEEIIQDSLKAAMDAANALGNDKLADQVGNTITFFTREYVVGDRND